MIPRLLATIILATAPLGAVFAQFDHSHAAWTALLKKNVVVIDGGKASQARYGGFAQDRAPLKAYLDSLSKVARGGVQRLVEAAAHGVPHQRLQRVHGGEDPDSVP